MCSFKLNIDNVIASKILLTIIFNFQKLHSVELFNNINSVLIYNNFNMPFICNICLIISTISENRHT